MANAKRSEPSLTRCKKNIHVLEKAECLVCKSGTYISVVHKGNGDLNIHLQSEKHRKAVRGAVVSTKMTNYFVIFVDTTFSLTNIYHFSL